MRPWHLLHMSSRQGHTPSERPADNIDRRWPGPRNDICHVWGGFSTTNDFMGLSVATRLAPLHGLQRFRRSQAPDHPVQDRIPFRRDPAKRLCTVAVQPGAELRACSAIQKITDFFGRVTELGVATRIRTKMRTIPAGTTKGSHTSQRLKTAIAIIP